MKCLGFRGLRVFIDKWSLSHANKTMYELKQENNTDEGKVGGAKAWGK